MNMHFAQSDFKRMVLFHPLKKNDGILTMNH